MEEIKSRDAVKRGTVIPKTDTTPEQLAERFKEARARIDGLGNTDIQ